MNDEIKHFYDSLFLKHKDMLLEQLLKSVDEKFKSRYIDFLIIDEYMYKYRYDTETKFFISVTGGGYRYKFSDKTLTALFDD